MAIFAKRPVLVWVIIVMHTIFLAFGLLSQALILLSNSKTIGAFDYVLTASATSTNLAAVIYLFLLRRQALYLFIVSFVLKFVGTLWPIFSKVGLTALGSRGMIALLVLLIQAGGIYFPLIIYYLWRLMKKGVLR